MRRLKPECTQKPMPKAWASLFTRLMQRAPYRTPTRFNFFNK